ncbi:hypothetical protein L1077_04925 [Pseudoalteromonas luteoviolacea]|uniref:SCP domain-containing protein n=1 Tax=Pseudoalteromonas luteoviolacea H33 TaxID=1365251 RepID=A0A167DYT1_9GAMM|nr:hypothetical protein [Pseudoalteromonas luteoviolacea]KZN49767.1 hypothetical protein N476_18415 [Pseudoalteromonas luteoviolacea H33]KZN77791.1 hypothetical protein N477_00870 [Pseudoalteromonas luteoviolacea H33-S]MCF6438773.1 hypothetical protein [Pseudoalteromonas luteoviolacea]
MSIKILAAVSLISTLSLISFNSDAAMDLGQYKRYAEYHQGLPHRGCIGGIPLTYHDVLIRINYALNRNIITERAANWAKANTYYPIIDPFSYKVTLVCKWTP